MLVQTYPYIGQIKLNRLRPIALENMLMELRKRTCHGKTVQEATVQKYLTVVSAVLSDAKRNEIIQKNPARMIDLPATEKANQQIPTPEEAKRLLEILANEPEEYKLFYALAIYTGCRRGELCALRWSDFTCIGYDGILTVQHSRSSVLGQGIAEGTTKNGKARTIYLYDDMMSLLRGYGHYKLEEAKQNKHRFSEYLFVNADGTHIHPDTFTKRLRKIYDQNGFSKHFHLHTLRHYFVSTMLHSGVDKQTVADLAGHGDTSFLERTYCHPHMALKEQAAKKMFSSMLEEVITG